MEPISIDEQLNKIHSAWDQSNNRPMVKEVDHGGYVVEAYDDYVVVRSNGGYYRVGYTETDGEYSFDPITEWQKVERQTEWIEKARIRIVKASNDEWALDVLANPFGSTEDLDSDGDFFDASTEYHEDKLPLPPVVYFHGLNEKGDLTPEPEFIGKTTKRWVDNDGVWYRVVLDKLSEYAQRIWKAAKKGAARASTGVVLATARKESNGHISSWMNGELSLLDLGGGRAPANKHAVAIPALKAVYNKLGKSLPVEFAQEAPEAGEAKGALADSQAEDQSQTETIIPEKGEIIMDPKPLTREDILAILKADKEQDATAAAAEKAKADAIEAAKEEGRQEIIETMKAGNRPDVGVPNLILGRDQNERKWDGLEPADHALAIEILSGSNESKWNEKAAKSSLAAKLSGETGDKPQYQKAKFMLGSMMLEQGVQKAAELNYTTQSGYGDEWVGVAYSTVLWDLIRDEAKILPRLNPVEIPQGYESMNFLTNVSDPTFYKVAESTAIDSTMLSPVASVTASKQGTGDQSLTLGKMGARVVLSGEMQEDSIIAFIPTVQEKMRLKFPVEIDNLILNGDTETGATTNINDIGGTPAGTESFLVINGMRKLALVTNTANARSAAGGFSTADFLETLKLMGASGINALDPSKVAFVIDAATHWASLELPEVKTRDVSSRPTIENGQLTSIYGSDVIASAQMHAAQPSRLANSAGKCDLNTAGNNLYGAILGFRSDQWKFGWKRHITMETTRIARSDAWEIIGMARFGLVYRDTEASAITYYVGV